MFGKKQMQRAYDLFKNWQEKTVLHRDGSISQEYFSVDGTRLKKLYLKADEYEQAKKSIDFSRNWFKAVNKAEYPAVMISSDVLDCTIPMMNEIERQILSCGGSLKPENFYQIAEFAKKRGLNYERFREAFFDTREGMESLFHVVGNMNNIKFENVQNNKGTISFKMLPASEEPIE